MEKEEKQNTKKEEQEIFDTKEEKGLLETSEIPKEGFEDISSQSLTVTTTPTTKPTGTLKLEETLEEDEQGLSQEEINKQEEKEKEEELEERIKKYGQTRPTEEEQEENFEETQGELYGHTNPGEDFYSTNAGGANIYSTGTQQRGGNFYSTGEASQGRNKNFYSPTQTTSGGADFYSGKNNTEKDWVKGIDFTSDLEKKTQRKAKTESMNYGMGSKKKERSWV